MLQGSAVQLGSQKMEELQANGTLGNATSQRAKILTAFRTFHPSSDKTPL